MKKFVSLSLGIMLSFGVFFVSKAIGDYGHNACNTAGVGHQCTFTSCPFPGGILCEWRMPNEIIPDQWVHSCDAYGSTCHGVAMCMVI
jgi:hypothetical protein